jgi:ABC-type transporter MlaC component
VDKVWVTDGPFPDRALWGREDRSTAAERVDANLAAVSTKIMTKKGTEISVDYRLLKRGDRWMMIYDISVEGISLVSNYRTQFNKIIQTNGYTSLVEKMKSKQTQFAEEAAQKKKVK